MRSWFCCRNVHQCICSAILELGKSSACIFPSFNKNRLVCFCISISSSSIEKKTVLLILHCNSNNRTALYNLEILHYEMFNDCKNAEPCFSKIVSLEPKNTLAMGQLINMLICNKKIDEAMLFANIYLTFVPDDTTMRNVYTMLGEEKRRVTK